MSLRWFPALLAGAMGLGLWATECRQRIPTQAYQLNRFDHYPDFYFPHNYGRQARAGRRSTGTPYK